MIKVFRRDLRLVVSLTVILIVAFCALFAPLIAPHDPNAQDLLNLLTPPVWAGGTTEYPLGTDGLGRDILSRLIHGASVAMLVAVVAATGAMFCGTIAAVLAGYFGGWIDWLICRAIEIWLAFPPVVLSLLLIVGLGVGVDKVILAIILVDWTRFARVLRSEVMVVRRKEFVAYAELIGMPRWKVVIKEVFPAVLPMLVTLYSLQMGASVVVEAILSFVGMGVPADIPAWGQMIADARVDIYSAPWSLALPILAVFGTVFGFNLLGDSLKQKLGGATHGRTSE